MDVSIIIPTLNEAQAIKNCLLPLQPLRQQNCEIIIVDGGSSDITKTIAQPLADVFISAAKGRSSQMNAGADRARHPVLLFLHADTYLPVQALKQITAALENGFDWGRFDIRLTGTHPMLTIIALMMNWRSRLTGIATGDQAIFIRKNTFNQIGQYPDIALMEDIALCKQLKKSTPPFCINTKVTSSGRRWEHHGMIKTILLMWWLRAGFFLGFAPKLLATLYFRGKFWKL